MPIKFVNIRNKIGDKFQEAVADTEPKIAALWSSSDHSPNITQGQDLGWRLAPEVVVEMKKIKQDITILENIARRYRKNLDELGEIDILHFISDRTPLERAPIANEEDYKDDYDAQVKAAEVAAKAPGFDETLPAPTTTETTTKSIAELEAELEARKAAEAGSMTDTTIEQK